MDVLMSYIWVGMVAVSIIFAAANGELASLSSAVISGAGGAVELCISIAGAICFWSAIMEVMRRAGLMEVLSKAVSPLLRRIYPKSFSDKQCADALTANFSANLLGLGNAATPAGIRAAKRLHSLGGGEGASNELCRLVIMNTASLQLLPTTVASVRAALGSQSAFDILPCVWITSIASVTAGLLTAKILEGRK